MHLILLSGGSGKRLWPLSNDSRSKQFLKLLPSDKKLNRPISMLQRTWQQLQNTNLTGSTIVSTSKSQIDMIHNQIGTSVPLVIEPSRRDTYPAIALSSVYLYSVKNVPEDEIVVVMPVDSYVEDEFFQQAKNLGGILQDSNADLALIGINPTFPSEKYGYIIPSNPNKPEQDKNVQAVRCFKEKPTNGQAKQLISEGALWNSGVFAFKLDYILQSLKERGITLNYTDLLQTYSHLPARSFDYEIVENTKKIVVVSYNGAWKDLGTWNTLTEEMDASIIGKGIMSSDCNNVHIINELDIPVSVLGLSDLIVAVSPDGILVSDKKESPRVKEIADHFENRPMYEERRWGWYRVLDFTKCNDTQEVLTKRIGVTAGQNLSYQKHFHRSEVWIIIKGKGLFVLNGKILEIQEGDVLQIPAEALHGIKAITDLEFIEVQAGTDLIEEDIVRIFMKWEDIEAHCTNSK
ncbi:mannose-1-phosphate guanylyltransferase [Paenibacillus albiflavus]|uniref:Mannose-1-phosphate guanylyltransferase n=1 Tax=Paenibacillus albiflavus TaxID=2545760 RepID=A0A4R4EC43_9BACL|nr:sugar phosphate nucleotidyltransferase [Paenibacillus albiflavus]TCZ75495.1 mannose-1-phosphate guanylyltransferase [Paenibacillus albiflavus]